MIKTYIYILALSLFAFLLGCKTDIENYTDVPELPEIFPDYTGILIPPNIAPLNFIIKETGNEFEVRIFASRDKQIIIRSKTPTIQIDINKWKEMLGQNLDNKLFIEVYVRSGEGSWQKFKTITNEISNEKIDSHLAYRLINTGYVFWNNLGIYQRNLENFDEKPILENKSFEYGCLNCHSFRNNDPDNFMMHIRAVHGGTIISRDGKMTKVDLKTNYTLSAGVYPNWHPDGKHIAFSVNNINQFFCSGEVRIEVSDEYSDIVVYDIEKNTILTSPKISTANRENLPVWAPDGKTLYFISAAPAKDLETRNYAKYSLMRIPFNALYNTWGEVDTALSFEDTDKSISFPKISPDGKFLMFCMSDNGYFTIHHPNTDLYLLDLETGKYHEMEVNSKQTDSYHGFSSDGRWFVFSSKRMDGLFTRPFFSYLDENGNASKPFVLPQEHPEFYNTFIKNYNVPELITGEVKVSALSIRDKVLETSIPAKIDPSVDTVYMKEHLANPLK